MFFNLSDFSPFIQLLVGSIFIVNYYDSKHEEPFAREMRDTRIAIDNFLQRFQGKYDYTPSMTNWKQEKVDRLKIISLVLALFGCIVLLYSGIVSTLANNSNSNQCCHNYKFQSFNLFYLLSIAIPSITVLIFLFCVLMRYGHSWENLKKWNEHIFWIMILSFVLFFILGQFFYFPCPTILVNIFHTLALFDCVFWTGIRYGKSWYLNKKISYKYYQLVKLYYKSRVEFDIEKFNEVNKLKDNVESTPLLNERKKKKLKNKLGRFAKHRIDTNTTFGDTTKSVIEIQKDLNNILKKLNRISISEEQDSSKSCCSFCPHAINQSK